MTNVEKANHIFARNKDIETVFVTADGQCFSEEHKADSHSQRQKEKKVEKFERKDSAYQKQVDAKAIEKKATDKAAAAKKAADEAAAKKAADDKAKSDKKAADDKAKADKKAADDKKEKTTSKAAKATEVKDPETVDPGTKK